MYMLSETTLTYENQMREAIEKAVEEVAGEIAILSEEEKE